MNIKTNDDYYSEFERELFKDRRLSGKDLQDAKTASKQVFDTCTNFLVDQRFLVQNPQGYTSDQPGRSGMNVMASSSTATLLEFAEPP